MKVVVDCPFASIKYLSEVRQLNFPSEPKILQGRLRSKWGYPKGKGPFLFLIILKLFYDYISFVMNCSKSQI